MKINVLIVVALVTFPLFVSANDSAEKPIVTTISSKQVTIKEKEIEKEKEKEKEKFFIRLLVPSTNKCIPLPLCG